MNPHVKRAFVVVVLVVILTNGKKENVFLEDFIVTNVKIIKL